MPGGDSIYPFHFTAKLRTRRYQCRPIPTYAASAAGFFRLALRLKDFNLECEIDMTLHMLGIDIAKSTFQLYGTKLNAHRW